MCSELVIVVTYAHVSVACHMSYVYDIISSSSAAGLPAIPKITWDNGENMCLLFNNTYGIFTNDTIISSFDIYFHQIGHEVRLQTWRAISWEKPDPNTLPDKPVEPKIKMLGQNYNDNFHYKGKEW